MGRQRRIGTTRAPLLGVTRAITPFNQPRNIVSDKLAPAIATTAGYRRVILEPGGNDPRIVMEDADLARAADLAVAGATRNSGQRRTAVKRILVVASVADEVAPPLLHPRRRARALPPATPGGIGQRCRLRDGVPADPRLIRRP